VSNKTVTVELILHIKCLMFKPSVLRFIAINRKKIPNSQCLLDAKKRKKTFWSVFTCIVNIYGHIDI
jgi:hypothetical protein